MRVSPCQEPSWKSSLLTLDCNFRVNLALRSLRPDPNDRLRPLFEPYPRDCYRIINKGLRGASFYFRARGEIRWPQIRISRSAPSPRCLDSGRWRMLTPAVRSGPLDSWVKRELRLGDTVIQNDTRHAWRSPNDEPCVIVVVRIGARHDSPDSPDDRQRCQLSRSGTVFTSGALMRARVPLPVTVECAIANGQALTL